MVAAAQLVRLQGPHQAVRDGAVDRDGVRQLADGQALGVFRDDSEQQQSVVERLGHARVELGGDRVGGGEVTNSS
ncbi:hypothetical protein SF12_04425 [Streptomyces sp. MBRL 601]|nr:hypothetical protein SF12_04425 [Streptomyces sp. MBRL 601]